MEYEIIFCSDGILRFKYTEKSKMFPAKFIQEKIQKTDMSFWFEFWNNNTFFEKDLTIGNFLKCLEPWQDFLSQFTGKKVNEYILESKKLVNIKEKDFKLDWISLNYITEINPKIEYEKSSIEEMKNFEKWLNTPKDRKLTGYFDIDSFYKLTGYKIGEQEQYCVEYSSMSDLKNIPFVLSQ